MSKVEKAEIKKGKLVECVHCKTQWYHNGKHLCPVCYQTDIVEVEDDSDKE